ncbi:conserved hypothetical protein, secreted [Candidatus Magnetomorum sp. HK-1]|nr:conserved hypothetical protein, secreted [Candidatus Magnetomorum sp. HK-1]
MKQIIVISQFIIYALCFISLSWAENNQMAGCALDLDYTSRNYISKNFETDIDSTAHIQTGEEILILVVGQNVSNLDTYQVIINYNPSNIEFIKAYEDYPLDGIHNLLKQNKGETLGIRAKVLSPGKINITNSLIGNDTSEAPEGSGVLCVLKFKMLNHQTKTSIRLSNVYFVDSDVNKDDITHLKHALLNDQSDINQAPIANDDHFTMLANQSIQLTVLSNDHDPDDDPIKIISFSKTKNGQLTQNKGDSFTYIPETDFMGSDMFEYIISDSKNYTALAKCSIEVFSHQLNLSLDHHRAMENDTLGYDLNLSNPKETDIKAVYAKIIYPSDILKFIDTSLTGTLLESSPYVIQYNADISGELLLSIYSTSPSYVNSSGSIAQMLFKVTGTCGESGILSYQMTEMNEMPITTSNGQLSIISPPTITVLKDQTIDEDNMTLSQSFTIADCDSKELTISTLSDNTTLFPNNKDHIHILNKDNEHKIHVVPAANQSGAGTITVMITDADGLTSTSSFMVNVNSKADKPDVIIDSSMEGIVNNDIELDIQASLTDLDGSEELAIKISDLPENAVLTKGDVKDGVWEVSPEDLEDLKIQLSDNFIGTFTLTVAITSTEIDNNEQHIITDSIRITCSGYHISGKLAYYSDRSPVENVVITIKGDQSYTTLTNAAGVYSIVNLIPGNYEVVPSKTDDAFKLSNTDAGYVGLHVINKYPLTCMQKISADCTQSSHISPLDASYISIAATKGNGIDCVNDQCIDWVFTTEMIEECTDLSYTNKRKYLSLDQNKENQDFIAIRLGDISGKGAAQE